MIRSIFLIAFLTLTSTIDINAQKDSILIDFGSVITPYPWNSLSNPALGGSLMNLLNSKGYNTPLGISVYDAFNSNNVYGTQTPSPALNIPATASGDSFFGNTLQFGNKTEPTGGVIITGLNPQKMYELKIFASRTASDNRETQYTLIGQTTDTLYLDVSSNTSLMIGDSLFPAADSTIRILAEPGPNNNNSYGFYYLGVIMIIYDHEPVTGPVRLKLASPVGGEYWQSGKTPSIMWESFNTGNVVIEYSLNNGSTWIVLDTVPGYLKSYPWTVPYTPSNQCLVRITADTLMDISTSVFKITNDTAYCPVVVLGSSTAYGAGASTLDSSWVGRFRMALSQRNTRFDVINLAKGGYNTYHILPDSTYIPPHISFEPDTARNITKALTYKPFAIIINMPSNDAANQIPASDQMQNIRKIKSSADSAGALLWVTTSQPRNFSTQARIQIQNDFKDSVLIAFGDFAIDFWSGVADANSHINSLYDSGDGIHLNNLGHKLLFQRVWDKSIDTIDCAAVHTGVSLINKHQGKYYLYPNPSSGKVNIASDENFQGEIIINFYNTSGQLVKSFRVSDSSLDLGYIRSGFYIYTITKDGQPVQTGKHLIF